MLLLLFGCMVHGPNFRSLTPASRFFCAALGTACLCLQSTCGFRGCCGQFVLAGTLTGGCKL